MKGCFQVELLIRPLPEGGWSIEVPGLQGCHVEGATLEAALAEIQEAIALILDLHLEEAGALPPSVRPARADSLTASVPIVLGEHEIRRVSRRAAILRELGLTARDLGARVRGVPR